MNLKPLALLSVFLLFGMLLACQAAAQQKIRVAVAANLMIPMEEIEAVYERANPNVDLELIGASSGKLTAQIRNSAPFHIFLSADMNYPTVLHEDGFTAAPPQTVALGLLVLWTKQPIGGQEVSAFLQKADTRTVAIAQPELAPYGEQAKKWLSQRGLYGKVRSKLIYGESIGKVNQYIYSRSVDVAFTAISAMNAAELKEIGHWTTLPQTAADGIPHGGAVLKYGTNAEKAAAEAFFSFLFSAEARAIFQQFGYGLPG